MTARWFTIRRSGDGYEITYVASDCDDASGVYLTTDLAAADRLTDGLRRLGYSEVQ